MCGIAGYLGRYGQDVAKAMSGLISHRGPDDDGFFFDRDAGLALIHRRLAIIDLSPAGHQPMTTPNGRFTICYNGEIYNYRELRDELVARGHALRGHSDTEVILGLFAESGPSIFARLNGIFALAIWDSEKRELTLARDGLGVKPLYFTQTARGFSFSSEMKALLALPDLDRTLDPAAAASYLTYLWTPGRPTMLSAVRKLDPGSWISVDASGIRASEVFYRLPDPVPVGGRSDAALIEGTGKALATAVERQMIADVEVGSFLSGGLDSSAIVALARRHAPGRRLQCFTIAYDAPDGDEIVSDLPYARKAAAHLDVDLHEVRVDDRMADDFEALIYQLDEPEADPAALNSLYIARHAREMGIKVLLSGTGGDDVFTGYRRHRAAAWFDAIARIPALGRNALAGLSTLLPRRPATMRRVAKLFGSLKGDSAERISRLFEWLPAEQAITLLRGGNEALAAEARAPLLDAIHPLANAPAVEQALRLDQKFFLTDHNLNYTDKTGMAEGVEIRVPFLDPDLMAWAAGLPLNAKLRGGETKWVLRKAMEAHLPHDIIYRPKSGFGVPLRAWLNGPMRPMLEELLTPAALEARGIFDPMAVRRLKEATLSGRVDGSYTLLAVIAIELWSRRFLDRTPITAAA